MIGICVNKIIQQIPVFLKQVYQSIYLQTKINKQIYQINPDGINIEKLKNKMTLETCKKAL